MDADSAGSCRGQLSSVIRLKKQMEVLARDEDISVRCTVASEEDNAVCCQSSESSARSVTSPDCADNDDDGLIDVIPAIDQQLDEVSGQTTVSHRSVAFNSAIGNAFIMSSFMY